MKTSSLIIIGIIIIITISAISIFLAYNQEIKLIMGMQTDPEPSDYRSPDIWDFEPLDKMTEVKPQ